MTLFAPVKEVLLSGSLPSVVLTDAFSSREKVEVFFGLSRGYPSLRDLDEVSLRCALSPPRRSERVCQPFLFIIRLLAASLTSVFL